jgi:NifU-like protein involved in Fe-S cluster formation
MCSLADGLDLDQALEIQPEDVETELGGLPEDHLHCARLAVNTLGEAIADYYKRRHIVHCSDKPENQAKKILSSDNRDGQEN